MVVCLVGVASSLWWLLSMRLVLLLLQLRLWLRLVLPPLLSLLTLLSLLLLALLLTLMLTAQQQMLLALPLSTADLLCLQRFLAVLRWQTLLKLTLFVRPAFLLLRPPLLALLPQAPLPPRGRRVVSDNPNSVCSEPALALIPAFVEAHSWGLQGGL